MGHWCDIYGRCEECSIMGTSDEPCEHDVEMEFVKHGHWYRNKEKHGNTL